VSTADLRKEAKALSAVLLHGFMGSGSDWCPVAARLAQRHRCQCPDLPGHGKAPLPDALTWQGGCDQVESELDRSSTNVLIGYSMGGRIALQLAARRPEVYGGLVLVSASPGLSSAEERAQRAIWVQTWADAFRSEPIDDVLGRWYEQDVFGSLRQRPELLDVMLKKRRCNNPAKLARVLESLDVSRQPDLRQSLGRLTMDVLVIAGAEDAKYCGLMDELGGAMAPVRRVIVPDAGHAIHLEQPEVLSGFLEGFMAGLDAYPG